MSEGLSGRGEVIGENTADSGGFDSLPKESFEEFRVKIASGGDADMSEFGLTSLESGGNDFAEVAGDDFLENQVKSPINGSPLEKTDTPGVMWSEYDDILYYVPENGEITPLKSPIHGGELKMTDASGIMRSEYDDILYYVSEKGDIVPLQSPINGSSLSIVGDDFFVDETTGQRFSLKEIKNG